MTNLKKYNIVLKQFVLFITITALYSCSQQKNYLDKIEGKKIGITNQYKEVSEIENFIKPYREHINKDLDNVLAYSPITLDKSKGEWQTNIGCLMADVTLQRGNIVFEAREHKKIDICLLNHGGIRAIIPKGNVTTRTAFEIMPFENNLFIAAIKGKQVIEMVQYIIAEKKPHPLSGMKIVLDKSGTSYKSITVQGQPVDLEKTYYVATSDYLINGGDSMNFFKKATAQYDMDYKLRNVLIDYFKEVDTLPTTFEPRIIQE
ncbi:5'-nucleotidase C-terminal domain-containing protein [Flavobacterium sp. '19STA2R22 D10 B1']|uniref:5'-nucleotidase C-terminal domain-containing protein n=1 Tax=Flavobacterium aerium TaxID=3037261 RepID=UPI00278C77C9|nr:5'-nucleotidase [Flavobacterium sp. '19STA2R22 D10 B1']